MTDKEFETLALAIKAAYPNFNLLDKPAMKIWFTMLADLDYKVAENAVLEHISTSKYPPSIADIRGLCMLRYNPRILTFSEAWSTVILAIQKYGYENHKKAYDMLDDLTLQVVKELGWYNICNSTNADVIRSAFKSAYESKARDMARQQMMPAFVAKQKAILQNKYKPVAVLQDKPLPVEEKNTEVTVPDKVQERIRQIRKEVLKNRNAE